MIRFLSNSRFFLVGFFFLSACQSGPTYKSVRGPDGKAALRISCERYPLCYEEAAKLCKGKYEIIPTAGNPKPGGPALLSENVSILVRCR